jgi:hypothetical protein
MMKIQRRQDGRLCTKDSIVIPAKIQEKFIKPDLRAFTPPAHAARYVCYRTDNLDAQANTD